MAPLDAPVTAPTPLLKLTKRPPATVEGGLFQLVQGDNAAADEGRAPNVWHTRCAGSTAVYGC